MSFSWKREEPPILTSATEDCPMIELLRALVPAKGKIVNGPPCFASWGRWYLVTYFGVLRLWTEMKRKAKHILRIIENSQSDGIFFDPF